MRAVVQRVSRAHVDVEDERVGEVRPGKPGLMVLLAAGDGDGANDVSYLAKKIAGLRIFEDDEGRMNLSVNEIGGSVLVVSQFTLYGDCRKGRRPSFVHAMEPVGAEALVDEFVAQLRAIGVHVETGRFRTHMQVSLINDGPVTLLLDSNKAF
ncbi:MAG: D-aminoacyl-tRNA deacylase [Myxococcota bacterium]